VVQAVGEVRAVEGVSAEASGARTYTEPGRLQSAAAQE